ncbi:hypothetical protein [Halalkalirubrum salinum]|uniref:hypothetical protein n=1 Tax=Halalkalirubrum salinum TaxID=2563889 RepID=UPI0010FB7843|nr:hypothetical protein [Halalkalirubrum salinum]
MIVVDTSAFISIEIGDALDLVLSTYEVHTTTVVVDELRSTAAYDDSHGRAADEVLGSIERISVHDQSPSGATTTRIDAGEASCAQVVQDIDAEFLITDDLRALPELEALVDCRVAISPILLRALVTNGLLSNTEAKRRLEAIAHTRDWLGAPIYRHATELFDT